MGEDGTIYPLQNRIDQGYAVRLPRTNPARHSGNAVFVNQLGEKITFYVEEISVDFAMSGSTAQSRKLRQFFPHSIVQPSVRVTGIAPNSYEYNRLAAFVRLSHRYTLMGRSLRTMHVPFRNVLDANGETYAIPTIQFALSNATNIVTVSQGRNVKGRHKPWRLEGYVKSMKAGAERFQQAPAFQFDFVVAESLQGPNLGIWNDHAVLGSQIASWAQIFRKRGENGFIRNPNLDISGIVDDVIDGVEGIIDDIGDNIDDLLP